MGFIGRKPCFLGLFCPFQSFLVNLFIYIIDPFLSVFGYFFHFWLLCLKVFFPFEVPADTLSRKSAGKAEHISPVTKLQCRDCLHSLCLLKFCKSHPKLDPNLCLMSFLCFLVFSEKLSTVSSPITNL